MGQLLRDALRSLRGHWVRVGLTSTGIVWGIALLTVLSAYATGFERHFVGQMEKIGRRLVYVYPGVKLKRHAGDRGAQPLRFEVEDANRLARLQDVEYAAPEVRAGLRVLRSEGRTKLIWTYGVTGETASIRGFEVARGRFIGDGDVDAVRRVVFLGASAAVRLFGRETALGRRVDIDGVPFRVVGVSEPKGDQILFVGPQDDELAFVPVTSAQRWLTRSTEVDSLLFAPVVRKASSRAIEQARLQLSLHHDFDVDQDGALGFFNVRDAMRIIERLSFGLRIFLAATGLITLVVGGIGVMNIMLVSVSERTAEVGLRKALGGADGRIFALFLLEALLVCLGSGALGALLGVGAVRALAATVPPGALYAPTPVVDLGTVALQGTSLFAVGVAAGLFPAWRAARVDPSISLRAE